MAKICYYGDKLSPNMAKTPEGFLVCRNVPIARTGYQKYLESEIKDGGSPNRIINVYRSPQEVFSPATLASFEGKPVTDEHPNEDVTPENYHKYSKGHVQNVRIGKGEDSDKILADLYITDPKLMETIHNGKREVSAGYYADELKDRHGRICQHQIRGNHVAVVQEGRAGRSVCIRDAVNNMIGDRMNKKQKIATLIARYLKDAKPEEIGERLDEVKDVLCDLTDNDEDVVKNDNIDITEDKDNVKDGKEDIDITEDEDISIEDELRDVLERLKNALAKFNLPHDDSCDEDVDIVEDCDDLDITEDEGKDGDFTEDDEEDVNITEDEDEDEDVTIIPTREVKARLSAKDSTIRNISRAVMKIKDPHDRRAVQDAIIRATSSKKSQMAGVMQLTNRIRGTRNDSCSTKMISVTNQQRTYDAMNPHKEHQDNKNKGE